MRTYPVFQGTITMQCPSCGAANMVHDIRDLLYTYKGESTILSKVTGEFCSACDGSILDAAESRRTMRLMLEFRTSHLEDRAMQCNMCEAGSLSALRNRSEK